MVVDDSDLGMSTIIQTNGIHEPEATAVYKRLLKPGMKVLEVGANLGYYAFIAAEIVGATGHIYALEPSLDSYALLKKGIVANGFNNIEAFAFALGDKTGVQKFNVSNTSNFSNLLDPEEENLEGWARHHLITSTSNITTTNVVNLNTFVKDYHVKTIDIIRMDVEGFELNILESMLNDREDTLSKINPGTLFIEFHFAMWKDKTRFKNIFDGLLSRGYSPYNTNKDNSVDLFDISAIDRIPLIHIFWIK